MPSVPNILNLRLSFLHLPNPNSLYNISPFRSLGGGAVVSVFKGFSCMGRSEARFMGRILPEE